MTEKIQILIKNFNSYSSTLIVFIADVNPTDTIKFYRDEILKLESKQSNIIIDTFVLNALQYEDQILQGDDDFFLNQTFDDITSKNENSDNLILKIFEFKNIWKKINDNNKTHIKNYMKILCQIARVYVNLIIELRDKKQLSQSN